MAPAVKEKEEKDMAPASELDGPPPKWAETLFQKYNDAIAHGFILYGPGVADYGHNFNSTPIQVLEKHFSEFDIVVTWDRAHGFTFSPRGRVKDSTLSKSAENFKQRVFPEGLGQRSFDDALAPFLDPVKALYRMTPLLRKGEVKHPEVALIIDMAEFIAPDADLAMMRDTDRQVVAILEKWGQDNKIAGSGNVVILMVKNLPDLHGRLRAASAKYEAIELPIPVYEDRLEYIRWFQTNNTQRKYEKGMNDEVFAQHTAGLTRKGIEDILFKVDEKSVVSLAMVQERKYEIIRSEFGDVVRVQEPRGSLDDLIGGYGYLKDILRKRIVTALKEGGRADWGGLILAGPPGVGKSVFAEGLAFEAGVNCLYLDLTKVYNKYVGESGKALARVLGLVKSMTPCIVFIDELDVALPNRIGGGANDSGVSNQLLSMLMPFMADPKIRQNVVWVGATNHLDNVDAALKRPGRFDRVIPVLVPEAVDREFIINLMVNADYNLKKSAKDLDPKVVKEVSSDAKTQGWTGAEILMLVDKTWQNMKDTGDNINKALENAVEMVVPNTKSVEYMTALALSECNDRSLLPPSLREKYDRAKEESKVAELEPVFRRQRRDN